MTNAETPTRPSSSYPRLKVLYLIGITLGVFLIPPLLRSAWPDAAWLPFLVVGGVLVAQVGLLLAAGVRVAGILGACSRLKWLFVFVVLCATFLRNLGEGSGLPPNPTGVRVSAIQRAPNVAKDSTAKEAGTLEPRVHGTGQGAGTGGGTGGGKGDGQNRGGDAWVVVSIPGTPGWRLNANISGLQASVLMCLQIATVLLVSSLVRVTGTSTDLVDGLRGLGFPQLFCYAIDNTLALIGGVRPRPVGGRTGGGSGKGKAKGKDGGGTAPFAADKEASPGFFRTIGKLMRGDLAFFLDAIRAGQEQSKRRIEETVGPSLDARLAHDAAVISGIGVMLMSMKLLKVLPGISFASGYKTLLYIPLYLSASRLTYSRWGATAAGSILGVIGLMMGDGRSGVFEVIKHIAPGLVIDLLDPFVLRLPQWKVVYAALGFIAAATRTLTNLALILLPALSAGNLRQNPELLMFPAVTLLPNIFFGTVGGIVAYYVVGALTETSAHPSHAAQDVQIDALAPSGPVAVASACQDTVQGDAPAESLNG